MVAGRLERRGGLLDDGGRPPAARLVAGGAAMAGWGRRHRTHAPHQWSTCTCRPPRWLRCRRTGGSSTGMTSSVVLELKHASTRDVVVQVRGSPAPTAPCLRPLTSADGAYARGASAACCTSTSHLTHHPPDPMLTTSGGVQQAMRAADGEVRACAHCLRHPCATGPGAPAAAPQQAPVAAGGQDLGAAVPAHHLQRPGAG